MSVIQQVYLAEAGYSIYIKGIKPDKDNECSGEITINGNPTRLERKERYHIDGSMLVTDNYHIPMDFIINFLQANGCIEQKEDGKRYVVLKEYQNLTKTLLLRRLTTRIIQYGYVRITILCQRRV